jgi:[ribosomal protein S5]-alanine N-acetyltransferase
MAASLTLADRPRLTTERLVLRRPDAGDIDAIVAIVGDWDVASRLARVPHPYGLADARFFLEQVVPIEWVWAITTDDSDVLTGVVGLTPEDGTDGAELGYWLAKPHWGRGLMTEAAGAVLSFGFDSLHLSRITSGYLEENFASGRVLEKLGFLRTGSVLQPSLALGADVPVTKVALLPERWHAARVAISLR